MTRGGQGLFEAVTGHFANGAAVDDLDLATRTFMSVQDNILHVLNSRRNGLLHLPDYGLDDLSEIYRHLPSSAYRLRNAIESSLAQPCFTRSSVCGARYARPLSTRPPHPNGLTPIHHPCNQTTNTTHATTPTTTATPSIATVPAG